MAPGRGGMGGGGHGMGGGRGMGGGGGGMDGGDNIFGLIREVASMFSGGAKRQSRPDPQAVNEELRRQAELLKEERGLLKERVDLLERRLELLEADRVKENKPSGG